MTLYKSQHEWWSEISIWLSFTITKAAVLRPAWNVQCWLIAHHTLSLFILLFSLFPGYNVFALSIISELVEDIEPYTFKRFEYQRVWGWIRRRLIWCCWWRWKKKVKRERNFGEIWQLWKFFSPGRAAVDIIFFKEFSQWNLLKCSWTRETITFVNNIIFMFHWKMCVRGRIEISSKKCGEVNNFCGVFSS